MTTGEDSDDPERTADSLFDRIVVPVASPEDARATAAALSGYLDPEESTVVAVHVVEKAGGAPDKASVEQREEYAGEAFTAFLEELDGELPVEKDLRYSTDVSQAVIEAAAEHDATGIVFTPRGGSRWIKLLTGDVAEGLIEDSDRPVVVLPDREGGDPDA